MTLDEMTIEQELSSTTGPLASPRTLASYSTIIWNRYPHSRGWSRRRKQKGGKNAEYTVCCTCFFFWPSVGGYIANMPGKELQVIWCPWSCGWFETQRDGDTELTAGPTVLRATISPRHLRGVEWLDMAMLDTDLVKLNVVATCRVEDVTNTGGIPEGHRRRDSTRQPRRPARDMIQVVFVY